MHSSIMTTQEKCEMKAMDDVSFFNKVDLELKRAERYSVFVSLVVFDLTFLRDQLGPDAPGAVRRLFESTRVKVREIDQVSVINDYKLVLLLPETPRQGAEIAGRRVNELLRDLLSTEVAEETERIIPMEMASYPDAAGARSIADFLHEYSHNHRN
jgi:hypothetical protein